MAHNSWGKIERGTPWIRVWDWNWRDSTWRICFLSSLLVSIFLYTSASFPLQSDLLYLAGSMVWGSPNFPTEPSKRGATPSFMYQSQGRTPMGSAGVTCLCVYPQNCCQRNKVLYRVSVLSWAATPKSQGMKMAILPKGNSSAGQAQLTNPSQPCSHQSEKKQC